MKNKFFFKCLIFLLSGVLVALGQPDRHPVFALCAYLFGYSALFSLLLDVPSRIKRAFLGFGWAAGVQLFQLNWMATTFYHGNMILVVYLFLCFWLAVEFACLALILPRNGNLNVMRGLTIASVWTVFEWSRLYFFCGFPFNSVGLVLTYNVVPMQLASIVGIYGLSFWVIFSACMGAAFWQKKTLYHGSLWLFILGLPYVFGNWNLKVHAPSGEDTSLHVALIQLGLSAEQKWVTKGMEREYIPPIVQWQRVFRFLEERGKEKYDIIVLPESALPGDASDEIYDYDEVKKKLFRREDVLPPLPSSPLERPRVSNMWIAQAMANLYGSDILVGFLESDFKRRNYNSAFLVTPFKEEYDRYDKRVLVPMTEYLPLAALKSIAASYGLTSFFTAGIESKVFQGKVPYAVSICYEEGYSEIMREGRQRGAEMFINLTNDGWFPRSRLPVEHFNLGRVRAVENGVPVLRSCNTGVTAVVDCFGGIVASMGEVDYKNELISGALVARVNCHSYPTVFSRFGNGLIVFLSLIIIAFHGLCILYTRSKHPV